MKKIVGYDKGLADNIHRAFFQTPGFFVLFTGHQHDRDLVLPVHFRFQKTHGFKPVCFGHIHVPVCEEREGVLILNPGSAAIPKENSPHSCMCLEDGVFQWIDLESGHIYKEYRWEA